MQKRILIVTLEHFAELHTSRYLVKHLAQIWRNRGHDVVAVRGIDHQPDADVVFSHTDITRVPPEYQAFMNQYPVVINGKTTDISKTLVSQHLLKQHDDYSGPVIVKTVANFGGMSERFMTNQADPGRPRPDGSGSWRSLTYLDSANYPVFRSIETVPEGVWENEHLIVEKFLPERNAAGHFCLRKWFFFGDREFSVFQTANKQIIKTAELRNELIQHVPEELRSMRRKFGIDYGRFDYGMVNGEAVIYDVNKTPNIGDNGLDMLGDRIGDFASGMRLFLNR